MGHPTCITTVIGCSMESPITHVQFHSENSIICFLLFYDCNSGASIWDTQHALQLLYAVLRNSCWLSHELASLAKQYHLFFWLSYCCNTGARIWDTQHSQLLQVQAVLQNPQISNIHIQLRNSLNSQVTYNSLLTSFYTRVIYQHTITPAMVLRDDFHHWSTETPQRPHALLQFTGSFSKVPHFCIFVVWNHSSTTPVHICKLKNNSEWLKSYVSCYNVV